ncbi:MAG: LLM class F420-dependent oxidoreductase [bacterium]|nr:LLM class F420-dependent oxidoreductase [bacterium]
MRFGVMMQTTDRSMSPIRLAQEAEARGYACIYLPEHTHIPTSRRTPPPTGEEVLPETYLRTLDPYIALAACAQATTTVGLGVGVALPAQHDPIAFAKQCATLDWMSDGRLVLGVGYGWNHEEMENHGIDVPRRRARVREHMLCAQALWGQEVAEFHGEFVHMEPSWCWPKPIQQPRIRTIIGAAPGPTTFAHIAEFGDGWMPIGGAGMRAALDDLAEAMIQAGRSIDELELLTYGTHPDPGKLAYYRDIGITEVVLRFPHGGSADEVLPVLDDYTRWIEEFGSP